MTTLSNIIAPTNILSETNTATVSNKTISGSSNTLSNLDAANLASGTVPTARLGSGTADATTFLRGDNTWAAAGGGGGEWSPQGTYEAQHAANTDYFNAVGINLQLLLTGNNYVKLVVNTSHIYTSNQYMYNRSNMYTASGSSLTCRAHILAQLNYTTGSTAPLYGNSQGSSNILSGYYFAMFNAAYHEIVFHNGRYDSAFAYTPSAFQFVNVFTIGNSNVTTYGPLMQWTTIRGQSLNFSNSSDSIGNMTLYNASFTGQQKTRIEVYTK